MSNIDPTVIVAALGLAGVLVGAIGTLVGVLIRGAVETRRIIAATPTHYRGLVDELQEERSALALEMASMRARLRGLEAGQDADRRLIEVLREHIVELRAALRRAGIVPPPAPPGSGVEDSGEHVAVVVTGTPA